MILELFLSFFAISLILIIYGYYSKNDLPRIIGFTFIFLLGVTFEPSMPGEVLYKSGTVETYVYSDNYTILNTSTIYISNINSVNTYTEAGSHTLAFWIMMVGALGLVNVMLSRRAANEN